MLRYIVISLFFFLASCRGNKPTQQKSPQAKMNNNRDIVIARERAGYNYFTIELLNRGQTMRAMLMKNTRSFTHIYLLKARCDSIYKQVREPFSNKEGYRDMNWVNIKARFREFSQDDLFIIHRLKKVVDSLGWCHKNILNTFTGFTRQKKTR